MAELFERNNRVLNLHLISGEDIIGMVTEDYDDQSYIIENPVIPNLRSDGIRLNIQLVPYRPWLSEMKKLVLPFDAVMFAVPVDKQMADVYRQSTSVIDIVPADSMPKGDPLANIKL